MSGLAILLAVIALVCISAVFSGLNIAVMSLNLADLKRKVKLGDKAAKRVLSLRKNSHLTLASILLSNVAAISATSLVLEGWFSGLIAGILSTLLIVIFGEVLPQALFARYALSFTAFFAPLLKVIIIITYPVSKPLQLLLDKVLGDETTRLNSRHELGIIISEHLNAKGSEMDENEIEIMRGALTLSEKQVRDIMTPIGKVFYLHKDTVLDGPRIDQIKQMSKSRIPIFNEAKTECYGILLLKDLIDIDFESKVYKVKSFRLQSTTLVGQMTALDTLFRRFIASSTHLLPVERDDKIVGIVTVEDLIEEIIGQELEDESDRRKHNQTA